MSPFAIYVVEFIHSLCQLFNWVWMAAFALLFVVGMAFIFNDEDGREGLLRIIKVLVFVIAVSSIGVLIVPKKSVMYEMMGVPLPETQQTETIKHE